jgi:hypothetical protein
VDLADLLKGKAVIDACNPFPNRDGEIANWAREKGLASTAAGPASCAPSRRRPHAWASRAAPRPALRHHGG